MPARRYPRRSSLAVVLDEGVVLLGGAVGQRMKPVGVVARAAVDGPALHAFGHTIGELQRDALLIVDGVYERLVGRFGKIFEHLLTVEDHRGVVFLHSLLGGSHLHCLT